MARKSRWLETSNVRLPLELRSDRRETSATRVSEDLQISIFERQKNKSENILDFFFGLSSFSADFRGARLFLTSKSNSSRFFALESKMVKFLGLYDPRGSFSDFSPSVRRPAGARHGQRRFLRGAPPPQNPPGARHG